jgi:acetyltransferase-like isoleucine patch superfamily enzyme
MRKDHRPRFLATAQFHLYDLYARQFLHPQFEKIGAHPGFFSPRHMLLSGPGISVGDHFLGIATHDRPIRLSVWSGGTGHGRISIGNYTVLSPGVRISSAEAVDIGDNCFVAHDAYITDADWHYVYHRACPPGKTRPVVLENNVWIADSAIVCKGVHVGENSVVGAGAVVVRDVPPNVIVAGNPARTVRELDPDKTFTRRQDLMASLDAHIEFTRREERALLGDNTVLSWLRSMIMPDRRS